MTDTIYRQAAIDELEKIMADSPIDGYEDECRLINALKALPSAQPTLYGYNIEHLILIANVLRKENLPPERVVEALTDIGRIVSIVTDEFEESLQKAVEQCKI